MAFCIVVIVRIIRPVILIRFGKISAYIFGTFVFDTEFYLREKGLVGFKSFDLFFYDYKRKAYRTPTNYQWDKMVRRKLRVYPFISFLYKANMLIPGGEQHIVKLAIDKYRSRDPNGILTRTDPVIGFYKDEIKMGTEYLRKMGLGPSDKFVCLNVRDSFYKTKFQNWKVWSYHDHRDSSIDRFEMAALYLAERGYWVFRMGKIVDRPLTCNHQRVIDYASTCYRSDFLDIWLSANCFFFISTDSGLDNVAKVFNRPIVFVNSVGPITYMMSWIRSITYPKKLKWKNSGELLSLLDQVEHNYSKSGDFHSAGIEVEDLSAKEITEAVKEMEARILGTWVDMEGDNRLQSLFWEKFKSWSQYDTLHGWIHPEARVGAHFLRRNPEFVA